MRSRTHKSYKLKPSTRVHAYSHATCMLQGCLSKSYSVYTATALYMMYEQASLTTLAGVIVIIHIHDQLLLTHPLQCPHPSTTMQAWTHTHRYVEMRWPQLLQLEASVAHLGK